MKTGKPFPELVQEIQRQAATKRDFLAPSKTLAFWTNDRGSALELHLERGAEYFYLKEAAHGKLAERLDIPKRYYDRMRVEAPGLFAQNVNHWLKSSDKSHLVRTLDGHVRAVLSEQYRPLDNADLAEMVFPLLQENQFEVVSAEITDRRLYVKAVSPLLEGEVRPGDIVRAGVAVSNSEIGDGTLRIDPFFFFLVCTNGLYVERPHVREYHIGRYLREADGSGELFRAETRAADDLAFWLKLRDVLRGAVTTANFERQIARLRSAAEEPIEAHPVRVVELAAKRFRLTEGEQVSVLEHFLTGHNGAKEQTRYGLMQAVTRASHDAEDYDRATELEQLGGKILELSGRQWREIAEGWA